MADFKSEDRKINGKEKVSENMLESRFMQFDEILHIMERYQQIITDNVPTTIMDAWK